MHQQLWNTRITYNPLWRMIRASFWMEEWNQLIILKRKASLTTICTMSNYVSTIIYHPIFFFFTDLCTGWATRTSNDTFVFNLEFQGSGSSALSFILCITMTLCNSKDVQQTLKSTNFFNVIPLVEFPQWNSFVQIYLK